MGEEDSPKTDSTILFYDEIQGIISHQITVYTHLRNQAQRLIRILIAAGAIIIAVTTSDIIQIGTNIPRFHSQVASNLAVSVEFVELTSQINIIIGATISTIGVLLVLDAFLWAAKVLQMRGLQPLMGEGSHSNVSAVTYSLNAGYPRDVWADEDASKWIENNDNLLYKAKEYLRLTHERLGIGILLLVFGAIVLLAAQMGTGRILALLDAGFVILVITALGREVWKSAKWLRRWSDGEDKAPFIHASVEVVGHRVSEWPHLILIPLIILAIGYGFLFSLLMTVVWLFKIVLPALYALL